MTSWHHVAAVVPSHWAFHAIYRAGAVCSVKKVLEMRCGGLGPCTQGRDTEERGAREQMTNPEGEEGER